MIINLSGAEACALLHLLGQSYRESDEHRKALEIIRLRLVREMAK